MPIRRFYDKRKTKWCKVVVNAPDGRFGTHVIEGGLTPKSAEHEAKQYSKYGMIVDIFPADG